MREAMARQQNGIRIIAADLAHLRTEIQQYLAPPSNSFWDRLYARILPTKQEFNPFTFLYRYEKPLTLYFDENTFIEEIALDVKNVVSDNANLKAVFAFTPTQREAIFAKRPEFAYRVGMAQQIVLSGLSLEEKKTFVAAHARMPLAPPVLEYVLRKTFFPQQIIDTLVGFELQAQAKGAAMVDETCIADYAEPTSLFAPSVLTERAKRMLALIREHPEGIRQVDIAAKLGYHVQTIYGAKRELAKQNLIAQKGQRLFVVVQKPSEGEGLGA